MLKRCKVNVKKIFAALSVIPLLCITFNISAKDKNEKKTCYFFNSLTGYDTVPTKKNKSDTIKTSGDTSKIPDSTKKIVTIDSLNVSADSLDAPVNYGAEDSGVLIIDTKKFVLYGKANVAQKDMKLTAGVISYDQGTQLVKAYGGTDTTKNDPLNKAEFTDGNGTSKSDTITYNLKTQRGLTQNTFYKEQELFINTLRLKKVDSNVAYAFRSRFTTCNLDTPHFDFYSKKLKIINNKIAVSGPAYPEFEGVPIPIYIPFGIFPLQRGRHSGLLPPQFASSQDFGLGLEGLGYYKVLNDNWDVTVRTNLYSYGGWNLDIQPEYYKRYRYRGSLDLSIQKTKILNSDILTKSEFTQSTGFFITWSHSTDSKARPGVSFSASVRAGSTKFNQYIPNNALRNFENQLSSSINYSKIWGQGKYNLSVAANHDQNNVSGLVNVRLPTVNFSVSTLYPFQKKEFAGTPKWYQKLGVSYTGTALNQFSFYDSIFNFRKMLDTAQWGADHRIPISLSLPPLGPLLISPGISYEERWYGQLVKRTWDNTKDTLLTSVQKGFYTAREMSFSVALNTRIFGTFNFPHSKGVTAIRHEIKPFISANYKPDFVHQYFRDVQVDTFGNFARYSQLENGAIGSFSEGQFGGLSFGIDNLLEMKVKNKKDTSNGGIKKVRLIDGLGITGGYNFLADSLQWSPLSLSFRSTLFEKINITGSGTITPYDVDTFGRTINRLLWKHGSLGRFTSGSLAISTSLQSKSKDERKDKDRLPEDQTLTPDEQMKQLEYVRENPAEFVDFNTPWNVQISFSLSYYRQLSPTLRSFTSTVTTNLNLSGDYSITPKWKVGGSTYFDFKTTKIQTLTMFITREMHCWQLAINITPVGLYRSFSITLNPKSGILRDLRINRSRFFYNQP